MEEFNYLAILAAMVVSVVVGMVWYSDPVFGRAWKRMNGLPEKGKPGFSAFIIWVTGSYVMSYTMYRLLFLKLTTPSLSQALLTGALISVGIVIAGMAPSYAFAKKPLGLAGIEIGYVVVSIMLMSVIIQLIQG